MPVEKPRDGVSKNSLKHIEGNRGETYGTIVASLHWQAFLVKYIYHSPTPIIRDLTIRKRRKENGVAMTEASILGNLGWISSGPGDLDELK